MSIDIIRGEIKRFLADPVPEVIAIKGRWGVGKTFSWNRFLEDAQRDRRIAFQRYSYVSLFGVNSLDSLKFSIFEQMVDAKLIGSKPSLVTFRKNSLSSMKILSRQGWNLFSSLPKLKDFSQAINSISFLSVSRAMVCIDDLERKGDGLPLRDVLGLVSYLKENKHCKVVLLLNDGEEGLEDFEKYREKVVDVEMVFDPSPKEAAEIALDFRKPEMAILGEYAERLEIKNIRILKKIERLVALAMPMLTGMEEEVVRQVIHSVVLFTWCAFSPKPEAPSIEFVLGSTKIFLGMGKDSDITEDEKRWISVLKSYEYSFTTELDQVLAHAVQSGILVERTLVEEARKVNQEVLNQRSADSYQGTWKPFHDSFADDHSEVVESLCKGIRSHVNQVSIMNLNSTVLLLRELGEDKKASEMIRFYLDARREEFKTVEIDKVPFFENPVDDELKEECDRIHTESAVPDLPGDVLNKVSTKHGWNPEDEELLGRMSVEDFFKLFKEGRGTDLHSQVNGALLLGRLTNATPRQKAIGTKAEQALVMIAKENALNRIRVKKYGVVVGGESS